jgi:hypothetical protein
MRTKHSILCAGLLTLAIARDGIPQDRGRVPVLLELFTSEGCSSCPPADALLEKLDRLQPVLGAEIIVLSEHVDYWDSLGWKDPFSSPDISARQEAYGRRFHISGVYTPQMVVDGSSEFVGSDSKEALNVIGRAARVEKPQIRLARIQAPGSAVTVRVEIDPGRGAGDVYLFVTDNRAGSQVLRGENKGRSLQHVAVVRQIESLGKWNLQTRFVKEVAARPTDRLVVCVQEPGNGRVLGAAMLRALP